MSINKHTNTIQIWQHGQFIEFEVPEYRQLRCETLYTVNHVAVTDDEHGYRVWAKPCLLVGHNDAQGCCRTLAGLTPIVVEWLVQRGYRCQTDPRQPLPPPRTSGHVDYDDLALLQQLRQTDRTLIRYRRGGVDPLRLAGQIAYAWPRQSVMVWVNTMQQAEQAESQLRRFVRDVTAVTSRRQPERLGRVVIATLSSLRGPYKRDIGIQNRDICIALDASVVFGTQNDHISDARRARMFGFLPDDAKLAPQTQDFVAALFGLDELHVPEHGTLGHRHLPVVTVRYKGGRDLSRCKTALDLKKYGIWLNAGRNRLVADVARRLRAGRPLPSAQGTNQYAQTPNGTVGVLVESLEHAAALARELPEASVIAAAGADLQGLGRVRGKIASPGQNNAPLSIITFSALAPDDRFDVLVRADGGPTQLVSPSICSVICDIKDRHNPLLRQWGAERHAGYHFFDSNKSVLQRWTETRPYVDWEACLTEA